MLSIGGPTDDNVGDTVESDLERNTQDWFRFMVDTNLAPGFRALGFFGTGFRFRLEGEDSRGELVVEQARSFSARAVRFTVHVGVVLRDEWSAQLRVRPYYPTSEITRTERTSWQVPIGELVTVGGYPVGDLWWELELGRPFKTLSKEILTTVREFALPAIRDRLYPAPQTESIPKIEAEPEPETERDST